MGLDMYLTKRLYVKNWDFMGKNEKHKVIIKKSGILRKDVDFSKISEVTIDVMYWRKVNAIHKWFVDNCQDGEDDCRTAYVDKDQLIGLINNLKLILQDNSKAQELLPTQDGFFFGGTDYDEWYFKELQETVDVIERDINESNEEFEYYYHSSW